MSQHSLSTTIETMETTPVNSQTGEDVPVEGVAAKYSQQQQHEKEQQLLLQQQQPQQQQLQMQQQQLQQQQQQQQLQQQQQQEHQQQQQQTSTGESANIELADAFHMKFSSVTHPFVLPTVVQVGHAAKNYFNDPGLRMDHQEIRGETVYRFELTKKIPKDGHMLKFSHLENEISVPLYVHVPERKTQTGSGRSREGVLLNFKNAGSNMFNFLSNELLDKEVTDSLKLTLIKPTEMQPDQTTGTYTMHRYCVVKRPENMAVIPESIPVTHPLTKRTYHIKVTYSGQSRYCPRCRDKHVGRCPQLQKFYAAKEERERMEKSGEIRTMLYGDSTLRKVCSLGLTADVCAMSGGSLGQVTQAALDNPKTKEMDNIVLVAGANDLKNQFETLEEFSESISGAIAKIGELAAENPQKNFTIVNSYPTTVNETQHTELMEATLHKAVEEYTSTEGLGAAFPSNVTHANVAYETDESNHPTLQGTLDILMQLTEQLKTKKPLVWNPDFIASEHLYRNVHSVYRYGCGNCRRYGLKISREKHHNPNLCDECLDAVCVNAKGKAFSFVETAQKCIEEQRALAAMEEGLSDEDNPENKENQDEQSNGEDNNAEHERRRKVQKLE